MNSDEAVTGIMAQHILGGHLYVYYPPQPYMGALEQYLQAGVLAILPSSPLTLRLVQLALSTLACALVWRLALQVTGERWRALLAAGLFALGPYYGVLFGVESRGAYDTAQLLALCGALAALALNRRLRRAPWLAAGLGLCCGLAVWESLLPFYVLIPALLWALGSARGALRRLLPWGLAGALVGAAPALAYQVPHGFSHMLGLPEPPTSYLERLGRLFDPVLGEFLGVRRVGTGAPIVSATFANLVVGAALAALAVALWRRRRGLLALVTLRREGRAPIDLVLAALALTPPLYAASGYSWYTGEPRYLFSVFPLLAVGLAVLVPRRRPAAVALAPALVCATCALFIAQAHAVIAAGGGGVSVDGRRVRTEDLPAVARALAHRGVRAVYADYWLAYPLQFVAGPALAVAPFTTNRFPDLSARVAAARDPALATPVGPGSRQVESALIRHHTRFRRMDVRSVAVFYDLAPRRTAASLGLVRPPPSYG